MAKKKTNRLESRIVEMRKVKASELIANDKNWRLHPDDQRGGLSTMLEKVGFVSPVIARETKAGLELVDGHLRASIAGDEEIPVVVVDLTDAEVKEVLITFDPLCEIAEFDAEAMSNLIGDPDIAELDEYAYTRKLIQDLQNKIDKEEEKKDKGDDEGEHSVPDLELQPHEHYDYIVVLATNTAEWNILCEVLDLKVGEHKHRKRMGICRAVHAHKVIEAIRNA